MQVKTGEFPSCGAEIDDDKPRHIGAPGGGGDCGGVEAGGVGDEGGAGGVTAHTQSVLSEQDGLRYLPPTQANAPPAFVQLPLHIGFTTGVLQAAVSWDEIYAVCSPTRTSSC